MKKKNNLSLEEREFEKYLEKVEDPKNEREINRSLPVNATPLQVTKYKLCKKILTHQIENNLNDEDLTKKLDLSQAEVEDILFCEIEKFTLDRLLTYTSRLFSLPEIEIIVKEKNNTANVRAF